MSSFPFHTILKNLPTDWNSKKHLWIWNPDKIPPHIGISDGDNYFSLTFRGIEQLHVPEILKKANRSKTPFLVIELEQTSFQTDFSQIFNQFEKAKVNGPTCLYPIKAICGSSNRVNQLSDLLVEIQQNQQKWTVYGAHLPLGYSEIPAYSVADIMIRIDELGRE